MFQEKQTISQYLSNFDLDDLDMDVPMSKLDPMLSSPNFSMSASGGGNGNGGQHSYVNPGAVIPSYSGGSASSSSRSSSVEDQDMLDNIL